MLRGNAVAVAVAGSSGWQQPGKQDVPRADVGRGGRWPLVASVPSVAWEQLSPGLRGAGEGAVRESGESGFPPATCGGEGRQCAQRRRVAQTQDGSYPSGQFQQHTLFTEMGRRPDWLCCRVSASSCSRTRHPRSVVPGPEAPASPGGPVGDAGAWVHPTSAESEILGPSTVSNSDGVCDPGSLEFQHPCVPMLGTESRGQGPALYRWPPGPAHGRASADML